MKKAGTISVYVLLVAGILFFLCMLLMGNVLTIGEKLAQIHVILEYAFYAFVLLLTYFLIIHPVLMILVKPSFSIREFIAKSEAVDYKKCDVIARGLLKSKTLSEPNAEILSSTIRRGGDIKQVLLDIYTTAIPEDMNKIISAAAQRTMISTMIAPNGKLDSLVLFVANIRMIRKLIDSCGYKPTIPQLVKTFINIFATSLLYIGIEDIDLEELIPALGQSLLGAVPGLSYMISAAFQGIGSAVFTLRIGYITRNYLLNGDGAIKGRRSSATKEAFKALPSVIGSVIRIFPQTVQDLVNKTMNLG